VGPNRNRTRVPGACARGSAAVIVCSPASPSDTTTASPAIDGHPYCRCVSLTSAVEPPPHPRPPEGRLPLNGGVAKQKRRK
jgi:hypothetical protein